MMRKRLAMQVLLAFALMMSSALVTENVFAGGIISILSAQPGNGFISVKWTTINEASVVGFNVWRSENFSGPFTQINVWLIPGCGGCLNGANYSFDDANVVTGRMYYYQVECVNTDGTSSYYGPVSARIPFPFAYFYRFPWITFDASQWCLPYPPLDWDPRLGDGAYVLPHLENVKLVPANVAHGQEYWRITKVKFENIDEAGSDHSIYATVLDEKCKRLFGTTMRLTSVGGLSEFLEERPPGDLCNCNFAYPMYGDGYAIQIASLYPSDAITGMIMPMRRHVNYRITFRLTTKP